MRRTALQSRIAWRKLAEEFAEPGPDSMALRSSGVRLWTFMTRAGPWQARHGLEPARG